MKGIHSTTALNFSRDNHTNSEYRGQFLPAHQEPWVRGYLVSSLIPKLSRERRKESLVHTVRACAKFPW